MFFWLLSAAVLCCFHVLSCWPVKTSTCKDRSLHQQQCFCKQFHHPAAALASYCFRGSSRAMAFVSHWGQWEPACHPAQAERSALDEMRPQERHESPDHHADNQGPSQTSSSNILWMCAQWHILACIPVLAHGRGLWCPFTVSIACGCWSVKVKDRWDGCSEQWGKWGWGEMRVRQQREERHVGRKKDGR